MYQLREWLRILYATLESLFSFLTEKMQFAESQMV